MDDLGQSADAVDQLEGLGSEAAVLLDGEGHELHVVGDWLLVEFFLALLGGSGGGSGGQAVAIRLGYGDVDCEGAVVPGGPGSGLDIAYARGKAVVVVSSEVGTLF